MIIRSVLFRGQGRDVVIDLDGGYEPDTNCHVIEWHFHGLGAQEHADLKMTDAEEEDIYRQLADRD